MASGREALVAMMQPVDLRYGDDAAAPQWLDGTRVRTILVEREMGSGSVVVVHVRCKDVAQMALVEDDDLIQALPPDRADHALDVSVLPP